MFALSSTTISKYTTGKKDITVLYSSKRAGSHTAVIEIKSLGAETVTVSLTGTTEESEISINGHEAVDLGLSVRWATCNIGASKPEGYGDHFAWGETLPKSSYDGLSSITYKKDFGYIGGDSRYDAARANWGGSWRMPTKEEIKELRDKCTWTWMARNWIWGYEVKSNANGNSIFLPAAGYWEGTLRKYDGTIGRYWSSTPNESGSNNAYSLGFRDDNVDWSVSNRYLGLSVRPVSD